MAKKKTTKKKSSKKTSSKAAPVKKTTAKKAAAKSASKQTAKKSARKLSSKTTKKVTKKVTKKTSTKVKSKPAAAKKVTKKKTTKRVSKIAAAKTTRKPRAPKKIKSPLSKKELKYYYTLLLEKRVELIGDIDGMYNEAIRSDDADLSHMPLHMADVGSDNFEQELTLGLVESERRLLKEIENAMVRIKEGTYGICEETGVPIQKARLEAKPWAKYTIEAAREMERRTPMRR